jgi:IS4 transposase
MINRQSPGSARRITLGADKGYDAAAFVGELRQMVVTPHIARNDAVTKTGKRRSALDARTTRHQGYAISQRVRKRIEEAFGWAKTVAGLTKTKLRGTKRNAFKFTFTMAAYNLIRMPRLLAAT